MTVCTNVLLVLVLELVSPPYDAVIECELIESDVVVSTALPELSVLLPMVVVPSLKVTVPVGVPLDLVTVAVSVTD